MPFDSTPEQTLDYAGQLLLDAADILRRNGWVQKTLGNRRTGYCLIGALRVAQCGTVFVPKGAAAEAGLGAALSRLHTATKCYDAAAWNDEKGRTKDQVIAALEYAATIKETADAV
jgi:hypothetical protein